MVPGVPLWNIKIQFQPFSSKSSQDSKHTQQKKWLSSGSSHWILNTHIIIHIQIMIIYNILYWDNYQYIDTAVSRCYICLLQSIIQNPYFTLLWDIYTYIYIYAYVFVRVGGLTHKNCWYKGFFGSCIQVFSLPLWALFVEIRANLLQKRSLYIKHAHRTVFIYAHLVPKKKQIWYILYIYHGFIGPNSWRSHLYIYIYKIVFGSKRAKFDHVVLMWYSAAPHNNKNTSTKTTYIESRNQTRM